jgi:hypothetical protein
MQARGEYGQGLKLEDIRDDEAKFVFVCPGTQQLTIQLQKDEKVIFNGELVKTPAVVAAFRDYRFATDSQKVADLIRSSRGFQKGLIKELSRAKEDAKSARARKVREMIASDPEMVKALLAEAGPLAPADPEAKAPGVKAPQKK